VFFFFFLEIQGNNVQNRKIELADGINKGVGHWESETTQTDQHRREFDAADIGLDNDDACKGKNKVLDTPSGVA
jgi:hypothetical protein